ncbi:unnamed protein product [Hermetia illucens]|uniref:Uncharacterized protein n=1 Tax=Hermetia illucens TaxID=343691 RepID=A0A7R8YSG0_HERIL|nr:unnamed protein product [Hermetia illucens]
MDKCSLKIKENNKRIRRLIRATAETSSVCDSPTIVRTTPIPTSFSTASPSTITPASSVVVATSTPTVSAPSRTMGGGMTTQQPLPTETYHNIPCVSPILTTCATCPPGSLLVNSAASTTDNKIGLKTSEKFSVSVFDTGGVGPFGGSSGSVGESSCSKSDGFNNNTTLTSVRKSSEIEIPQSANRMAKFSFKSSAEDDPYQYTITSPNNPFLPEIIAKRCSMDMSADSESSSPPYQDLVASPTSMGEPPPDAPAGKLSPMKIFGIGSGTSGGGKTSNPFLSSNCTSPQCDLNAKREEFLKATMKICLVVSPPSNKLQVIGIDDVTMHALVMLVTAIN